MEDEDPEAGTAEAAEQEERITDQTEVRSSAYP